MKTRISWFFHFLKCSWNDIKENWEDMKIAIKWAKEDNSDLFEDNGVQTYYTCSVDKKISNE